MAHLKSVTTMALCLLCACAAKTEHPKTVWDETNAVSIPAITPVFSQLVSYQLPRNFVPAFDSVKGGFYIQESVLAGESVEKWSQMITLSGAENLAMIPDMTSERLLGQLETRCRLSCLPSFSVIELGKSMIDGHEAAIAVFSCGTADDDDEVKALSGPHSESALVAVIKGERDYYTLQWAERGKASSDPLTLNKAQWLERFGKLQPIKLCKRIPGEKRPFPSCLGRP